MKNRFLIFTLILSLLFVNITAYSGKVQIGDLEESTGYYIYREISSINKHVVDIRYKYNEDKSGVVIVKCRLSFDSNYNRTVPREIDGLPVMEIAAEAFTDSTNSLYQTRGVVLPDTITKIGAKAFDACTNLTNITYCGSEEEWARIDIESDNTVLNNATIQFGETDDILSYVIENGEAMVVDCSLTSMAELAIPEYVSDIPVTKINSNAFFLCDIGKVIIPDTVTEICDSAFNDAQIGSFEFGTGLTAIGKSAFLRNATLTEISIPDTVTEIGSSAFSNCTALTKAELPDNLTSIPGAMFTSCTALTEVTIPGGVTEIGSSAFYGCDALTDVYFGGTEDEWNAISVGEYNDCLSSATIHFAEYKGTFDDNISWYLDSEGTLTVSGSGAISDSYYGNYPSWLAHSDKIKKLVLEDGITHTGSMTFIHFENLSEVILCDTLLEIGYGAFQENLNLKSIVIPEGVTKIESAAFYMTGLTEITIPKSVTIIEEFAFNSSTDLTDVYFGGTEDEWNAIENGDLANEPLSVATIHFIYEGTCGDNLTWRLDHNGTLTISGSGAMTSKPWSSLKDSILKVVIEDGVTSICNTAFHEHLNLEEVTLPDTLTSIEASAFHICPKLKNINLPDGLTKLDGCAFMSCYSLTEIAIPSGVEVIGEYAFSNCQGLTNVTIPRGVTEIGEGAFESCRSLTDVYFGGTEDEWNAISIASGNDYLSSATIHFALSEEEAFLEKLNSGVYETVKYAILVEGEAFGFDLTKYNELSSSERNEVIHELSENQYASIEEVIVNFDVLVAEKENTSSNIPSGGGGGGGEAEASGTCGESLNWAYAGGVLTIDGTGAMYNYEEGQTPWYDYRESITEVSLSDGITTIGKNAFRYFSHLTDIVIPDSVTSIGESAFYDCVELKNITLGTGVTFIDSGVFYGCNETENLYISDLTAYINIERVDIDSGQIAPNLYLDNELVTNLVIPEEITELGIFVFSEFKSIETVTIHGGITKIGESAFSGCENIQTVYYDGTRKTWSVITIDGGNDDLINHVLFGTESEEAEFLSIIGGCYDYAGLEEAIWDYRDVLGLDLADYDALNDSQRAEVLNNLFGREYDSVDDFLTAMDDAIADVKENGSESGGSGGGELVYEGVCGDNLEWFVTGAGVLRIIGDGDMYDYAEGQTPWYELRESVTEVSLSDGITRIGKNAFRGFNKIIEIVFPESVTTLGEAAMWDCAELRNITLGKNITSIENDVFMACDKTQKLYISDLTAYINIERGNYDSSNIAPNLYLNDKLVENLVIPKEITKLGAFVFGEFKCFDTITIHSDITEIGERAFEGCSNVETVNIYKGVTKIGASAFGGMDALHAANYEGSGSDWAEVEVDGGNEWLLDNLVFNADVEPKVSLAVQLVNDIYLVVPTNLQSGNCIVFACYKDDVLVYSDIFTYEDEIAVPFFTEKSFDAVKVSAWESMTSLMPLCAALDVPLS